MSVLPDSEVLAAVPEVITYTSLVANLAIGGLAGYFFHGKRRERFDATHDRKTGLLNERGLERVLEESPHPVALLYADVTNLKGVNDTMGHSAGDRLLIGTAAVLKGILRSDDAAARIGGDEFVVVLNRQRRRRGLGSSSHQEPMDPQELLDIVVSRISEGNNKFFMENPDLVAAGANVAVGGAIAREGIAIAETHGLAENAMYVNKAAQHAISQYRASS